MPAAESLDPRRLRRLQLDPGIVPVFLGAGGHHYAMTAEPIPGDALIVGASFGGRDTTLLLWSGEFAIVPAGQIVPEIHPAVRRLEWPPQPSDQ